MNVLNVICKAASRNIDLAYLVPPYPSKAFLILSVFTTKYELSPVLIPDVSRQQPHAAKLCGHFRRD